MLSEQEKDLFCLVRGCTVEQYDEYAQKANQMVENNLAYFGKFILNEREKSIYCEGLTEYLVKNGGMYDCAREALNHDILEKCCPPQFFGNVEVEYAVLHAYLKGRSE